MNLKILLSLTVAIIILICVVGIRKPQATDVTRSRTVYPDGERPPDHIIYGFLFQRVVSVAEKIKEQQIQGRIGFEPRFPLRKEAKLTEVQARNLEIIARACQQEVGSQDQKAKAIIQQFRAEFSDGKFPTDATTRTTESTLKTMWDERNAIVLRARDQLRVTFGEEAFYRLDQHVKSTFVVDALKGRDIRLHVQQ